MEKHRAVSLRDSTVLPPTCTAVNVGCFLSPYVIRIHQINDRVEKLNSISKRLVQLIQRRNLDINTDTREPRLNDYVVVSRSMTEEVDLPAWSCRGIITNDKTSIQGVYDILLIDYGTCVQLQREEFILTDTDSIAENALSFTVGLYNIVPACTNQKSLGDKENTISILGDWTAKAIKFAKVLIAASNVIYFDKLVSDEYETKYGELYMDIDGRIISLREALVFNSHAVYLGDELVQYIKQPIKNEEFEQGMVNNQTIFYINMLSNIGIVKNEKKSGSEVIKKLSNPAIEFINKKQNVLIYARVEINPLKSVLDAKFPAPIHRAWNSLVVSSRPKKIQSYMWPAIKKGLDVIAIGTADSGKTFGHVLAVTGFLSTLSDLPSGPNPSVLILCSSSAKVFSVHSLCSQLLQSYRKIRTVAGVNGKSERSMMAEMFNGCQILISTPRYLARFMKGDKKLLSFEKLRQLVLDDADIILDKYFDSISILFKKHKLIRNRELKDADTALQIIMTAKHWTQILKKTVFLLAKDPYICIASFIEATIFKSVRPKMYLTSSGNKSRTVLDILGDKYTTARTMIVCTTGQEAKELNAFLSSTKKTVLVHGGLTHVQLQDIERGWNACVTGFYPILICADEVLFDLSVTNIEWLIHYSISLSSKTQFNFRFSTLMDGLRVRKSSCKVTIMADEGNDVQFQSIMKIMQRMNIIIPEDISQKIERIAMNLDKRKTNYPICDNVKSWGFCPIQSSCAFRHYVVPEVDSPKTQITINDKVKLRVICVHDASHFSARILSYIKSSTLEEIEFFSAEYMGLSIKLQEYYSRIENRRRCETVNVGDICGIEDSIDSYKRVQVLRIETQEGDTMDNILLDVRCIDTGVVLTKVNIYRLLHIPEALAALPTQVVELFITGIAPPDDEYEWNQCAVEVVREWFDRNIDEQAYVIGTVSLLLRNTIWVDTLEIGTKLVGYDDLVGSSLKSELMDKEQAVSNDKHRTILYNLCVNSGLTKINGYDLRTVFHLN